MLRGGADGVQGCDGGEGWEVGRCCGLEGMAESGGEDEMNFETLEILRDQAKERDAVSRLLKVLLREYDALSQHKLRLVDVIKDGLIRDDGSCKLCGFLDSQKEHAAHCVVLNEATPCK